jgi:hypothetical protein
MLLFREAYKKISGKEALLPDSSIFLDAWQSQAYKKIGGQPKATAQFFWMLGSFRSKPTKNWKLLFREPTILLDDCLQSSKKLVGSQRLQLNFCLKIGGANQMLN